MGEKIHGGTELLHNLVTMHISSVGIKINQYGGISKEKKTLNYHTDLVIYYSPGYIASEGGVTRQQRYYSHIFTVPLFMTGKLVDGHQHVSRYYVHMHTVEFYSAINHSVTCRMDRYSVK